jgi:excisionase family DNA binding protein
MNNKVGLLTVPEAADILRLTPQTLRSLIHKGTVKALRFGPEPSDGRHQRGRPKGSTKVLIKRAEIDRLLGGSEQ